MRDLFRASVLFLAAIFSLPCAASASGALPNPLPDRELAADTAGTAIVIAIRARATDTKPGMINAEAPGSSYGIETFSLDSGNFSRSQAATSLSVRVNLMTGPGNPVF